MSTRNFFRNGDRVTVHGLMAGKMDGNPVPGRVICVNRKSPAYGMTVVVLCDLGDCEIIETFRADGTRYLKESACRITLGWKPK